MNIYEKLNNARVEFHSMELKKSGHNKFAGYKYFELADFVIPALSVFKKHGLCAVVSFDKNNASMRIADTQDMSSVITITSPMADLQLKGCHPIQNMGAIETYQRRYLWMAALEIVEHDAVDSAEPVDETAAYNALVDKFADTIVVVKESIKSGDLETAANAWYELDEADQLALWKAPSRGGCFSTAERSAFREFSKFKRGK